MQYVKCGFAGDNFPTSVFPCVVGRPLLRYEESLVEQELTVWTQTISCRCLLYRILLVLFPSSIQDIVVGAACAEFRHQLDISYPVSNGIVQNWDDMGHVWDHAFYSELKVQFLIL
ncbi:hypothetical protein BHE74_00021007 [Ensete ventricosum]|nr:hypothetical protein BHE74_00021007 [Ensete ventricosum]